MARLDGRATSESYADGARPQSRSKRLVQVRVRNLLSQNFNVYVDLQEDVSTILQLFARHEGLPKVSHVITCVRFLFDGAVLEPNVPLTDYGVAQGSIIQARICPRAWRGECTYPCTRKCGDVHVRCCEGQGELEGTAEKKSSWIRLPVKVITPFGEATGALELPEPYWPLCRLSPTLLTSVYCLTDSIGVNGAFAPGRGIYWQVRLDNFEAYTCMQPHRASDVWNRMASVVAKMDMQVPKSWGLPRTQLIDEEDTLSFGLLNPQRAHELHLTISLLYDNERAVYDATTGFREKDECKEEICCICLESMSVGEMCRQLPCLHRMHAGCCMMHLPTKPSCPVCRSSLAPETSLPFVTPAADRSPGRRNRGRPPVPSTPPLPNLPPRPNQARRDANSVVSQASNSNSPPLIRSDNQRAEPRTRSPVPRLLKVLSGSLQTLRSRSWSVPRGGRVLPQEQ